MLRHSLPLVIVIGSSLAGFAQTSYPLEYREYEVSLFAGQSFSSKFQFPTPVHGSDQEASRTVGLQYAAGPQVGVRISQNVNDFWSVNLEYSFANQDLRFTNISPSIQNLSLTQYIHHFSYNVSFMPLPRTKRFRPYADVGFGTALFYISKPSKEEALDLGLPLRDSWKFLGNVGGGFKYLIQDQFAVTVDLKDRVSLVPSYGIPVSATVVGSQYQPGMSLHGLMHNWQLNFGVTFQWDEW